MRTLRKVLVVVLALLWVVPANAATYVPFPDWWEWNPNAPADGVTREQYHSFQNDPNLNQPPDWTYNGFTPSQADAWLVGGVAQYGVLAAGTGWGYYTDPPGPLGPPYLNDNSGASVNPDAVIEKAMGNLERGDYYKEFYVVAMGEHPGGLVPSVSVSSDPGTQIVQTGGVIRDGGAPTWYAVVLEGTIYPQPDKETFTFTFPGQGHWIDDIYVGTHCVYIPEPGTMLLLGGGLLGLLARRRKRKK